MEEEEWKKKFLTAGAKEAVKGERPILRGNITEKDGRMYIALWGSPEFEGFITKTIKKVIKEM